LNVKILKIPIYIHTSLWISLLFIAADIPGSYREKCLWAVVWVFCLVVHELGHALIALLYDAYPIITLYALGGKTEFNESGITSKQSLFITMGGPALEAVLLLVVHLLLRCDFIYNHYYLLYFVLVTKHVNGMWLLLNLLPVVPLDGGMIVCSILQKKFGHRGFQASIIIGILSILAVMPYLYMRGYYIFLIMLVIYGLQYCNRWHQH